jgi:hypothetical protein
MQDIIIQLIISGSGVIFSIVGVLLVLAKKLGNGNGVRTNHQKVIDNGLQKQVNAGADGTKTLSIRFDDQVEICNQRWLDDAKVKGKIEVYMVEIRDRLTQLESRRSKKAS